jgi:rhomboid protease GluP
VFRGE